MTDMLDIDHVSYGLSVFLTPRFVRVINAKLHDRDIAAQQAEEM